jgi:tetratricopeptide (TPR) repeat protein
MLRRTLLGLVTSLIVARPLVPGEDPGLLDPLTSPASLVFISLWLIAAVGWAAWRAWTRQTTWVFGAVEGALAVTVGLLFLSAAVAARYQHPAWLIAWEWLGLFLAFVLVRQLARTPDDNHALLAALLATAVSLALYAIYQYAVELPRPVEETEKLLQRIAILEPDDPLWQQAVQRAEEKRAYATFTRPDSFAGFLTLLLPAALGLAWAAWRRQPAEGAAAPEQKWLLSGCVLALGLALVLTHSGSASLACGLVGAVVLIVRRTPAGTRQRAVFILLGVVGLLALGLFLLPFAFLEPVRQAVRSRFDLWKGALSIIAYRPLLGVGPGNFGRHLLPSYGAAEQPSNFLLEMWATGGLLTLAALLVALVVFLWRTWDVWTAREGGPGFQPAQRGGQVGNLPPRQDPDAGLHWEFYLGGMFGLVLGLLLRAAGLAPQQILSEGVAAGARCLIWFPAFALFYRSAASGPWLPLGLTAGVAALLLDLMTTGGISFPALAQPLWIVIALALNSLGPPAAAGVQVRHVLSAIIPLPVCAALAVDFFILIFIPVSSCQSNLNQARRLYADHRQWREQRDRDRAVARLRAPFRRFDVQLLNLIATPPQGEFPANFLRWAVVPMLGWSPINPAETLGYLEAVERMRTINRRLIEATESDPADAYARAELAIWYGEFGETEFEAFAAAVEEFRQALQLDPLGRPGLRAEYQVHRWIARHAEAEARREQTRESPTPDKGADQQKKIAGPREQIKVQYAGAARALENLILRMPRSAVLRFRLAETLLLLDDRPAALRQAREALKLDQQADWPGNRLSDAQREQIDKWLKARAEEPIKP